MTTSQGPRLSVEATDVPPTAAQVREHGLLEDVKRIARRYFGVETAIILSAAIRDEMSGHSASSPFDLETFYRQVAASDVPVTSVGTGEAGLPFFAGVPLFGLNGQRLGSFCISDPSPREAFSAEDLASLTEFGDLVSKVLWNSLRPKRSAEVEWQMATYDEWETATSAEWEMATSGVAIPNVQSRLSFLKAVQKRIDQAGGWTRGFAVLLIDIDSFERIRNSFESEIVDTILSEVLRRVQETTASAEGCVAARLGEGQVAVLMTDAAGEEDAVTYASVLEYLLRSPIRCGPHQVFLTASVGLAVDTWGTYNNAEQMLDDAYIANYRARRQGRAQCVVFSPAMRFDARARLRLESDLLTALSEQQFELFFQPKVRLDSGSVKGFEALIRWRHPERGMVPPMEFIPAAEETGLICEIGRWVISEAIRCLAGWRKQGKVTLEATMAVNLSPRQFRELDLLDWILGELRNAEVPPQCLVLEVTESILIENAESALALFKRVVAEGIGLDLDDFGTGYSCLSYLHQFPFRCIKIDKSFVQRMSVDPASVKLVASIVGLARSMDMGVIAEGVETEAQAQHLRDLGCSVAQGYLFSPPKPAAEIETMLWEHENLFPLAGTPHVVPMRLQSGVRMTLSGFGRKAAV